VCLLANRYKKLRTLLTECEASWPPVGNSTPFFRSVAQFLYWLSYPKNTAVTRTLRSCRRHKPRSARSSAYDHYHHHSLSYTKPLITSVRPNNAQINHHGDPWYLSEASDYWLKAVDFSTRGRVHSDMWPIVLWYVLLEEKWLKSEVGLSSGTRNDGTWGLSTGFFSNLFFRTLISRLNCIDGDSLW